MPLQEPYRTHHASPGPRVVWRPEAAACFAVDDWPWRPTDERRSLEAKPADTLAWCATP